ncbi:hypothetical protein BDZ89DRAFT_1152113 [Hymenopellis radicata]|nr:hypothetical protein BDZ89DRAFT_1152113 [Hymenopellis radicata]
MACKKRYLSDEDREFARRETKSQYWERNKDKLNAKARANGRAAKLGSTEQEDAISSASLHRNLRQKLLRIDARLVALTNNSLYDWAHSVCKSVMDLGDDDDAATTLLADICREPWGFLYQVELLEKEIATALGEGPWDCCWILFDRVCPGLCMQSMLLWT